MNVLFMNSARAWGGNEKWVRLAATALSREHQVFLAYRHDIVGNRVPVPKIRLPYRHEADLETIIKLKTFVEKNHIEVLIPSKRKDYALAGLVSKACGCINVLRLGIVRDLKNSFFQTFIFNKLADGVIVNAEPIREKLLESGFREPERIKVIHNGLDRDEIIELAGKQAIELPFSFTISAMGELSHRKGFDMLLRGFAHFMRNSAVDNAGLVIIGEGVLKESLQKLAESLHIDNYVIFTGFLDNPYPFLRAGDVFAMTSQNEGIPNALLEAMYLYNAPVCTPTGGTTEVIRNEENGFLVDYNNEKQLALTLQRLFLDRHLAKVIANNAHHQVQEQFSIEPMTRKIEMFCQEILSKKKIR